MISEEQEERIRRFIRQSELTHKALQEDLIDHFCCLVEEEMRRGQSFENALQAANQQIAPNGLGEIQEETLFLLNHKKRLLLHQCTYLSGYLFALSASLGTFFKLMQLPGATPLLYTGILGLVLVFLPLAGFRHRKSGRYLHLSGKRIGFLTGTVLIAACLFKVLHLQGAGMVLGLGFLLLGFGLLPVVFFRMFQASAAES